MRTRARNVLFAASALIVSLLGLAPAAAAQEGCELARRRFAQASARLRSGDLGAARSLLEAALASCPRVPIALNLATALHAQGRREDALAVLINVPLGAYGEASPEERAAARDRLADLDDVRRAVATIDVTLAGIDPSCALSVDGRPLRTGERVAVVLPGSHRIEARDRAGELVAWTRLEAAAGTSIEARLERRPTEDLAPARCAPGQAGCEPPGEPDWGLVALGVSVGVAILAGAAIATGVAVSSTGGSEPAPIIYTLTLPLP